MTGNWYLTGIDIKHLVYMPIGQVVLNIYVPCKIFMCPANICTSPVKLMFTAGKTPSPYLTHLHRRARNHKSLCGLGQDLHALGMREGAIWPSMSPCTVINPILLIWACGNTFMSSPVWFIITVDSRYLASFGGQNSRARVKWFSRYLALSREGPNSRLPWIRVPHCDSCTSER